MFTQYPSRLRAYLILVSVSGPLVAALTFLTFPGNSVKTVDIVYAGLLFAAVVVAEKFSLPLTHSTLISVTTAVYVAMFGLLPHGWPGLLAVAAVSLAEVLRVYNERGARPPEAMFNIGQTGLYVTVGAGITAACGLYEPIPDNRPAWLMVSLILAGAGMYALNTALVTGAKALQTGVSPFRSWRSSFSLDIGSSLVLIVFGASAAVAINAERLVLPAILLPLFLMQRTVRSAIGLRQETQDALASLVDVVELRDTYTAGHSRRVATTGRAIARKMGLTEEEADLIESAGRVHDLGKVAVDPAVLLKTGKLSDDEWTQMKLHPVYGADVVSQFTAYEQGTRLVRHHHERWDGAGYPDGIAGDSIPLGARILAVADTFDALTSDRPYRSGMGVDRAIAILKDGAGTQWDAEIVSALVSLLTDDPKQVPVSSDAVTVRSGVQAAVA